MRGPTIVTRGHEIIIAVISMQRLLIVNMDKFEFILFYFNIGMNYNDILQSLAVRHGVILSKRHFG